MCPESGPGSTRGIVTRAELPKDRAMTVESFYLQTKRQPCTGGDPPWCCQPAMTPEERKRQDWRIRTAHAAFMAEAPRWCPWLGHRDVIPVLNTNRRSWLCLSCRREISPGGEG